MEKDLGQYFTEDDTLQEKVFSFIQNNPDRILEPSVGRGDLVKYVQTKQSYPFDMYEIDKRVEVLENIVKENIRYCDFLKEDISQRYNTIIGNPPFVKKKQGGNLYIDFIQKCFNLLTENGELIFIVPSDFFRRSGSLILLNKMLQQGTFTDIYHPNNEKLFENASIDIIVFRYCKNSLLKKEVKWNGETRYIHFSPNSVQIMTQCTYNNRKTVSDYFHIYVGIVNGREKVFKYENGNFDVLRGKDKRDRYIYISSFPCLDENINKHLLKHKDELLSRRIKKFTEKNWFEWGALRNIEQVKAATGKDCLYIHNMTRKNEVCFQGKVEYFGGNLLILIPKSEDVDLNTFVEYFNSDHFRSAHVYSNRFKIGQRELCTSIL